MTAAYPDSFRFVIFMEKKDRKIVRIFRMTAGIQKGELSKLLFFWIVCIIILVYHLFNICKRRRRQKPDRTSGILHPFRADAGRKCQGRCFSRFPASLGRYRRCGGPDCGYRPGAGQVAAIKIAAIKTAAIKITAIKTAAVKTAAIMTTAKRCRKRKRKSKYA